MSLTMYTLRTELASCASSKGNCRCLLSSFRAAGTKPPALPPSPHLSPPHCVLTPRLRFATFFQEAREIFTQVREASSESCGAILNLAQLHALQNEQAVAMPLYQKAQKRNTARSVDVRMLEARALFDSNKLHECKRAIQKAIHLHPALLCTWHNLALAYERSSRNPNSKLLRSTDTVKQVFLDPNCSTCSPQRPKTPQNAPPTCRRT